MSSRRTASPPTRFRRWIGVDYSGAATADTRLPGLQVAVLEAGDESPRIVRPGEGTGAGGRGSGRPRNWTRRELAAWLQEQLAEPVPTIVGIDHALGHPRPVLEAAGHRTWDAWLDAAAADWPADRPDVRVADLRRAGAPVGEASLLRRTDAATAGAKPVFLFDVQGSVATSTHAGLAWIHRIRRAIPPPRLHLWPFDGWLPPTGTSVIAEAFPSLLRRRWPREGRGVDAHDAWCTAAWLGQIDAMGAMDHHLAPPLPPAVAEDARLEGWILGVH